MGDGCKAAMHLSTRKKRPGNEVKDATPRDIRAPRACEAKAAYGITAWQLATGTEVILALNETRKKKPRPTGNATR